MATKNSTRHAVALADLPTLNETLEQIIPQLADSPNAVLMGASTDELATAEKQAQQFHRSIATLAQHANELFIAINKEKERRHYLSTHNQRTLESRSVPGPPAYDGAIKFGLAQGQSQFVPTIYKVLKDFPDSRQTGFCKVRVGEDVRQSVDCNKMSRCTVTAIAGQQSAAMALEEWGGSNELRGMVCSVYIASGSDENLLSDFVFPDMQAAEAQSGVAEVEGRHLFCSIIEEASSSTEQPYLIVPTEYTAEWRKSAGLPLQLYVDCGRKLARTIGEVAGIHTPYEYVSSATPSTTGMHVEEAWLGSANIVLAGAPKVWLVVPPDSREALEAKVRENLADGVRPVRPCSQFVRHMGALISPRLLDKWKIPYQIVSCKAGEMILTLPGAYHQVVNVGPNYAQAINFAMADWTGPQDSYRFCGEWCPQEDASTAMHFQIGGEEQEDEQEEEQGVEQQVEQDEEQELEQEVEQEEEQGGGQDEEQEKEQEVEQQVEQEEEQRDEDEEEEEEEVGKRGKRYPKRQRTRRVEAQSRVGRGTTKIISAKRQTSKGKGKRQEKRGIRKEPEEQERAQIARGDAVQSLSGALIRRSRSNNDADMAQFNPAQGLFNHIGVELGSPRKRCASPTVEDTGNDNPKERTHNLPSKVRIIGHTIHNSVLSHPSRPLMRSDLDRWRDCIIRTAQGGGFNPTGIFQALQNAPDHQPTIKVLKTLQYICEVASIPWLLQVRARLRSNQESAGAIAMPLTPAKDQGIRTLIDLHCNISLLRTISWVAQYELAVHQLQYYQQFEAIVNMRRAETKKATDGRRNQRRRLGQGGSDSLVLDKLPSVQVQASVKREAISLVMEQGISEGVAKQDFEQYLSRGKTIHQLLGPASPSLLSLFPIYDIEGKTPSLDLLGYDPPPGLSEQDRKELSKSVDAKYLFKLNSTLAAYFGQQLFIARPELEDYWRGEENHSTTISTINLTVLSEQEVALTKPAEIARLFKQAEPSAFNISGN